MRTPAPCQAALCPGARAHLPGKGFHIALDAANALTFRCSSGETFRYAAHEAYFARDRPAARSSRRFIGPIGMARKRRLLSAARCLDPVARAGDQLARGHGGARLRTPVIAFPSGALPEIVEHGRTGLIVDAEEMAEAIHGDAHRS